jgi:hypothetical protein
MVKAAHLVPKSLIGEVSYLLARGPVKSGTGPLAHKYLFGVGEIVLSDPRNSKDLNHLILLLSTSFY